MCAVFVRSLRYQKPSPSFILEDIHRQIFTTPRFFFQFTIMALGLSIGDMIALTQLCYQVGKTLSDGGGAPEEFTGAQSLLYAIGEALKNLDAEVKKPDSIFAHEGRAKSLEILIYNCGLTLHRLEKLVKKYAPALGSGDTSKSFVRKFHDGWQKVMWVKEGPQLAILTGQLAVHQGALGLFTTTTNRYEPSSYVYIYQLLLSWI